MPAWTHVVLLFCPALEWRGSQQEVVAMYTVPQQVPSVPPSSLHHSIRHSSSQHKAGLRKTKFWMSFYLIVRQICVRYMAVYCSFCSCSWINRYKNDNVGNLYKSAADPELSFQLSESAGSDPWDNGKSSYVLFLRSCLRCMVRASVFVCCALSSLYCKERSINFYLFKKRDFGSS